jgi:hypothetical protein
MQCFLTPAAFLLVTVTRVPEICAVDVEFRSGRLRKMAGKPCSRGYRRLRHFPNLCFNPYAA